VRFENGTTGVIGAHDAWNTSRPDLNDFYIDVSDGNGNYAVQPGSPATFWREMDERGSRIIAKALDDRISCAIAIETMRQLKKSRKKLPNEVYFAFTVQEEVGLRGARTAAYNVAPDVAVALDVTGTGDEIKNRKMAVKLGEGAAIKLHDPGLVVPPAVRDWMIGRAEADKIPYQLELLTGGTTDASAIQTAHAGVPSGCISIPCRFIHTVSETVDYNDVQACVNLLTGLVTHPVQFNTN
jgi:endoglucanase